MVSVSYWLRRQPKVQKATLFKRTLRIRSYARPRRANSIIGARRFATASAPWRVACRNEPPAKFPETAPRYYARPGFGANMAAGEASGAVSSPEIQCSQKNRQVRTRRASRQRQHGHSLLCPRSIHQPAGGDQSRPPSVRRRNPRWPQVSQALLQRKPTPPACSIIQTSCGCLTPTWTATSAIW